MEWRRWPNLPKQPSAKAELNEFEGFNLTPDEIARWEANRRRVHEYLAKNPGTVLRAHRVVAQSNEPFDEFDAAGVGFTEAEKRAWRAKRERVSQYLKEHPDALKDKWPF